MSGRISSRSNLAADRRRSASEVKILGLRSPFFNPSLSLDDRDFIDSGDAESLAYSSGSSLDSLSDEYDPILVLDDISPLSRRRARPLYPSHLHPAIRSLDSEDDYADNDYAMMSETERRWRRVDRKLGSMEHVFDHGGGSSGSSLSSSPR
ncbi:Hypothetical protein NTJ_06193 [Nesidiocoris tenuis]|uniref:Uncharacterized protein n=1 Tax=Nesidiocoris tenuis TaxID=355587 RepID=A0ABN7APN7_9HEMI|nr:Hypothetical protein NTJ_06193 [Nesidiocoris tenuis]